MKHLVPLLLASVVAGPVMARTVIVPIPEAGPRCETTIEHGTFGPVERVGAGKFIQRGVETIAGKEQPGFLFVDCIAGASAAIGETVLTQGSVDPYVVRPTTTVDDLMRLSNERGDANSRHDGPPERPTHGKLTNIYCGCRLLYPGSKAAAWAY